MLLLLQCHNPTPQDMTGEKYTLGKGGKGTFKKYLMAFLQTFKYGLDSEGDLLEPLSCCALPASSTREAKPWDEGQTPAWPV